MWTLLDSGAQDTVRRARNGFDAATTCTAWGLLYVVLADAVEAVVDLRHQELARTLGILEADRPYTLAAGREVTEQLRKGT